MDLELPGIDGWEASRRLKTANTSGSIIALSAHALSGVREGAGGGVRRVRPAGRIRPTARNHSKVLARRNDRASLSVGSQLLRPFWLARCRRDGYFPRPRSR
jgi:CheY-like chemotaxis protein